jgi:hypothetical protein
MQPVADCVGIGVLRTYSSFSRLSMIVSVRNQSVKLVSSSLTYSFSSRACSEKEFSLAMCYNVKI